MQVIWKRPDGFHGASPSDFYVVELDGHSRLWLHRENQDHYPFKISGGWEEDSTTLLNNLINLIPKDSEEWSSYLETAYNNSMKETRQAYWDFLRDWLKDLRSRLKGDTWEVEILEQAFTTAEKRLDTIKDSFLNQ